MAVVKLDWVVRGCAVSGIELLKVVSTDDDTQSFKGRLMQNSEPQTNIACLK